MSVPIPEGVTLRRNKTDERWLLDQSRKWLESGERAKGLHASDLLSIRKAFWRTVDPQPLSDREIGLFLPGKILHAFVLGAAAGETPDISKSDEGSRFNEELKIWYSPDWDKGNLAEFKTARNFQEPTSLEDLDTYIQQLLVYMVCEKKSPAKVWVLYLNLRDPATRRTTPAFRCYEVAATDEDLAVVRRFIEQTRVDYEQAVATQQWRGLDLCQDWMCGRTNCAWYDKCQPEGRYGTKEFDK